MDEAIKLLKDILSARGSIAKSAVIRSGKDNEQFRMLLICALNPFLTYKVSEKALGSLVSVRVNHKPRWNSIFEVCGELSAAKSINNHTVCDVIDFLDSTPATHREIYKKILAKTLRLGVTAKTVNKVIPNLIPEWEVQQAYPIEKYPIPEGIWFSLSQKLNGIRATFYKGQMYARSGEVFDGLGHIAEALSDFSEGYVFDGELTLLNPGELSDNEAFRKAAGIVNSDAADKTEICFTIFDVIHVSEFESGVGITGFYARRKLMDLFTATIKSDHVRVLESLYQGADQRMIDTLLDQMVREDKEGLMLNLDVPYQRKRHKGILKVKRFYTMDLPIVRCEEGSGRLSGTLGALVLDFDGNEVSVGSGFTDAERTEFWSKREELPGMICEVKYKEVSSDKKTGARSLQFPVFVALRFDKEVANFE